MLLTDKDYAEPGTSLKVSVKTLANSLVGVLAVDEAVLLLQPQSTLKGDEVMRTTHCFTAKISVYINTKTFDNY